MIAIRVLLLLAAVQTALAAEPLRSGCSSDDQQTSSIGPGERLRIDMALAGDSQTCYKVTIFRPGGNVTGYVLGESLPAVADFVRHRERASQEAAKAEARAVPVPAPKSDKDGEPIKSSDPLVSTQFADFTAHDLRGKQVSLSSLKGRVTVVTFWSPANQRSMSQLESVMPLYNQLHSSGLAAVGVSMDPRPYRISQALDDVTLPFVQVTDPGGLAARYQVDPQAGKTFVLDANHRVVAAGPMGPDIVSAVHQLLGASENH